MSSVGVQNLHLVLIWCISDESDKGTTTLYLFQFSLSGIQIIKITFLVSGMAHKFFAHNRIIPKYFYLWALLDGILFMDVSLSILELVSNMFPICNKATACWSATTWLSSGFSFSLSALIPCEKLSGVLKRKVRWAQRQF